MIKWEGCQLWVGCRVFELILLIVNFIPGLVASRRRFVRTELGEQLIVLFTALYIYCVNCQSSVRYCVITFSVTFSICCQEFQVRLACFAFRDLEVEDDWTLEYTWKFALAVGWRCGNGLTDAIWRSWRPYWGMSHTLDSRTSPE